MTKTVICGECLQDSGISIGEIKSSEIYKCKNCGVILINSTVTWDENTTRNTWHNRNYRQTKFVEQIPKIRGEE